MNVTSALGLPAIHPEGLVRKGKVRKEDRAQQRRCMHDIRYTNLLFCCLLFVALGEPFRQGLSDGVAYMGIYTPQKSVHLDFYGVK